MERPAAPGTVTMTIAKDERSRAISPSWFLSGGLMERSASKPPGMIPESQLMLKNELELVRAQLCAQTKVSMAFEALSHSITLLEQEINQQQGRIMNLEEELKFAIHSSSERTLEGLMQKRIQELWTAVAAEVEGLRGSMNQKQSSVEDLSQEVLESKKFLWDELEAVQTELQRIHQKLKNQEVDITRNLVSIKKMQENQVKCTKFLAQLKGRVAGDAPEAVGNKPGSDEGSDDVWSAVDALCHSITNSTVGSDKRGPLRTKHRGSHPHSHRKTSSPGSYLPDLAVRQHRNSS